MKNSLLAALLLTSTALAQPIGVQLDGRNLQFDQPPVSVGGRLMVPLRGIFEALQAEVLYSAPTRSIKATKGSTVVELTLGSRQALINGKSVYLDVPADTLGGRTMVPLRFVSESLGAEVKWNGMTRTVLLSSGEPTDNPQNPTPTADKPRLDQVIHNATRDLRAGDSFDVVVTGDPGGQASFEILGSLRSQSMREVSPGRYERRFVVPNGLDVQRGVLVAHLAKDGQESLSEAKRTLNIGGSGSSSGGTTSVSPQPNSEVSTSRPLISVNFNEPFRRNSLRLYLDQVEMAPSNISGQQQGIQFTPQFDLSPGMHQVQAEALSRNGQKLSTQWSFRVNAMQTNFQLEPAEGQVVSNSRPRISASFGRPANRWRLVVDGTDVTSNSSRGNQQIAWIPNFDLNPGQHQVQVSANDAQGALLQKSWSFQLNGQNQVSGLTLDNLSDGSRMPIQFNVVGNATPGSNINLTVSYPKNSLGGVLTGLQDSFSVPGVVDNAGRYQIPLHIGAVPVGSRFNLTLTDSRSGTSVTRTLFRQ
jgi:hypothetical protein